MHISHKLKTAPTLEPITRQELKIFGRIDTDFEDALLDQFITAARETAENYTNRAFITQTWEMSLDFWSTSEVSTIGGSACCANNWYEYCSWAKSAGNSLIELDKSPLQSVTEIRTLDNADTATVVAASNFILDTRAEPGVVSAITIPSGTRDIKSIEIEYVAGYGDNMTDVPESIRVAIMMLAMDIYETRVPATTPKTNIANILRPYKVMFL